MEFHRFHNIKVGYKSGKAGALTTLPVVQFGHFS